jgi:hypothetical protein
MASRARRIATLDPRLDQLVAVGGPNPNPAAPFKKFQLPELSVARRCALAHALALSPIGFEFESLERRDRARHVRDPLDVR